MSDFSNGDNVIDSRDIIKRLEEMQSERESLVDDLKEWDEENGEEFNTTVGRLLLAEERTKLANALKEWDEENGEELKILEKVNEEGEGCGGDWEYGATLIREDYFTEYVEDMAEDFGFKLEDFSWIVVDWEATADGVKADYSEVEYDGVTYLVRG